MRKLYSLALCFLLSTTFFTARAATYTAVVTGNWSSPATWGAAGFPTTGDVAIIPAGITVTVDAGAGTLDGTYNSFDWNNPSRIEVFGTLNVLGNASAFTGVIFQNPVQFEVYSGGLASDADAGGSFYFTETSALTVYSGGGFSLFPGGGIPYSTWVYDQTVDAFGVGNSTNEPYVLGNDGTYFTGSSPTIGGPFTLSIVPSGTNNNLVFTQTTDPSSVTAAASSVGSTTATLNATVGSGGLATNTIQFQYSTDATLSSGVTMMAATPATLSAGPGTTSVSAALTGLSSLTTYYYRVGATNSLGTTQGNISSFSTLSPLPVNFISFAALAIGNDVELHWKVGGNQQANTYAVEHSLDGVNFSGIGQVANDPLSTTYSFVHTQAGPGTHYYRVLETDLDGAFIYSTVAVVTIQKGDLVVKVLNNPSTPETDPVVEINSTSTGAAFIELWSTSGVRIALLRQAVGTGTNLVDLPMGQLAVGAYVVKVTLNGHTAVTQVVKR